MTPNSYLFIFETKKIIKKKRIKKDFGSLEI